MKKSLFVGAAASLSVAAILVACGDDDSSSSFTPTASKLSGLVVSADDLPKCTSAKDGKILVADEEIAICDERAWTAFVCGEKDGDEVNAAAELVGDSALVITCDGDSIGAITKADVEGCEIVKDDEQVSLVCDEDTLATVAVKKETESSSSKAKSSESKDESSSSKAKSSESKDESSSSKAKSSESKDESSSSKAKSSESKDESSSSKAKSSESKKSSSSETPVSSTVPASSSSAEPTSSSEAPASSATEPESSATEPESSAVEPESSSEKESSSSEALKRDEVWSFLDTYVTWGSENTGTIRPLAMDDVTNVLDREDFVKCANDNSVLLFVKQTGKSAFMVFMASQKQGAKFYDFQVDIMRSLPEKIANMCKEPASSSSKTPFSSSSRPLIRSSSSREFVLRSSSSREFVLQSSSSRVIVPISSIRELNP